MRPRTLALAALTLACACGPRPPRREFGLPVAGTTVEIQAVIQAALRLDAAGDRAADTLYAPEAVVIANARQRFAAPRLAGVSYGGRITVGGAAVTVEGRWAWALIDYRWIGSEQRQIEVGRATVVAVKRDRGWRILHLHSSQQLPWQ